MTNPHLVAIGASLGGVTALMSLAAMLPPRFPAIVAVTLHIGAQASILPELLSRQGPNPALHPRHLDRPQPGHIYVAPPDHHLLLDCDTIRLSRGARENHVRPAVDPMFRSAAIGWGERAIGVVLTGELDDGAAGLAAIKKCGGIAIVQDPLDAAAPGMPQNALDNVEVDHCVPLDQVAALLSSLVTRHSARTGRAPPKALVQEHAVSQGTDHMNEVSAIGEVSKLTCPDCGGALWELNDQPPLRYRCHTGHAYTALSLDDAQASSVDHALAASLRALREREYLLLRLASVADASGDATQAEVGRREAARARAQADEIDRMARVATVYGSAAASG